MWWNSAWTSIRNVINILNCTNKKRKRAILQHAPNCSALATLDLNLLDAVSTCKCIITFIEKPKQNKVTRSYAIGLFHFVYEWCCWMLSIERRCLKAPNKAQLVQCLDSIFIENHSWCCCPATSTSHVLTKLSKTLILLHCDTNAHASLWMLSVCLFVHWTTCCFCVAFDFLNGCRSLLVHWLHHHHFEAHHWPLP